MVSLFPSFSNQGGEGPFYREMEASLSCKFPMSDCLPQRKKNLKTQNVGSTPLSLVIFQCGIVSHKRKKKNPKPQNLGSTNMPLFDRVLECNEHEQ